jgi:hypothetical protein
MAIVVAEKIVMRRTADLIPYANNSRTHSDKQVVQIASIREFGFTNLGMVPPLELGVSGSSVSHGTQRFFLQSTGTERRSDWKRWRLAASMGWNERTPRV